MLVEADTLNWIIEKFVYLDFGLLWRMIQWINSSFPETSSNEELRVFVVCLAQGIKQDAFLPWREKLVVDKNLSFIIGANSNSLVEWNILSEEKDILLSILMSG